MTWWPTRSRWTSPSSSWPGCCPGRNPQLWERRRALRLLVLGTRLAILAEEVVESVRLLLLGLGLRRRRSDLGLGDHRRLGTHLRRRWRRRSRLDRSLGFLLLFLLLLAAEEVLEGVRLLLLRFLAGWLGLLRLRRLLGQDGGRQEERGGGGKEAFQHG